MRSKEIFGAFYNYIQHKFSNGSMIILELPREHPQTIAHFVLDKNGRLNLYHSNNDPIHGTQFNFPWNRYGRPRSILCGKNR